MENPGKIKTYQKVGKERQGSVRSPLPKAKAVPLFKKKGMSEPSWAAKFINRSGPTGLPMRWFSPDKTAAASLLPASQSASWRDPFDQPDK